MSVMHNVGVIGCGYWGPNLIRNLIQLSRSRVPLIADLDNSRLAHMKAIYPTVETTTDYTEIIANDDIDAVAIATPVETHYKLASEALEQGKHVFVEKPITASTIQAQELVDLAARNASTLMVGHTFLYTAAVQLMKKTLQTGEIGDVYYINSQRLNLGLFQTKVNVVWDLAPHDVSIILFLLGDTPVAVNATGAAHINPKTADVASVTLHFENSVIAFIQSSWLDPDKIRRLTVVGSKKMMVYDDIHATEKIRVYDKSVERPPYYDSFAEFAYSYKYGDIVIPQLKGGEPIGQQLEHFLDCIEGKSSCISGGREGLQVVRTLEAVNESLRRNGQLVLLDSD